MDNYKRVVSYLYKYKNGNKGKNCGYVRAEKQGTSIKIYISLREEERTDGMLSLSFYMPKEKEPGMQAFCFGHCTMKDGTAEFVFKGSEREFFEAAAADAWQEEKEAVRFFEKYPEHPMRLKLEQISGVLCLWEGYEEEYFCSQWKDGDISPKELTWPAMGGKERGKEQAAEAQRGWGAESPEAEAQGERGAERLEEEAQGQGEREPENPEAEVQGKWSGESSEAEVQGEWRAERLEEDQGQGERELESPEAEVQGKWSGESSEAEVQGEWRAERLEEGAQGQGEREPEHPEIEVWEEKKQGAESLEAEAQGERRGEKQEEDVQGYGNREPEHPEVGVWKEKKQGVESPEAEVQGKWSGESSEAEVQGEWRAERLEEGAQGQGEREPEHPEIEVWKEKKQGAESLEAEAQGERRGEKQEEDVQGYGNREPEHPEVEVWKEKKQGVESPEAEVQGKWSGESSEAEAQGGWRVGRLAEKDREYGNREREGSEAEVWKEGKQGVESQKTEVQGEWRAERLAEKDREYGNREREGSEAEVWKEGKQEVERPEAEVQGEWSEGNSEAEAQGGWRAERLAEKDREYGNREPESPEIEVWKEGKQRVERPEEVQGEWSGGRPEAEAQAQRAGNPVRFQGKRPDLMGEDESMRKRIPMASFEQIFKDYPRLMPFSETQGVLDCVRMEPQDIGLFPIKEWELLNNPFLLHGYYCFRHLAYMKKFGKSKKMESKGKKREEYRLGVPGNYTNRERILARLSGFPEFLPAEGEKTEPGTFGYWCRKLELS